MSKDIILKPELMAKMTEQEKDFKENWINENLWEFDVSLADHGIIYKIENMYGLTLEIPKIMPLNIKLLNAWIKYKAMYDTLYSFYNFAMDEGTGMIREDDIIAFLGKENNFN